MKGGIKSTLRGVFEGLKEMFYSKPGMNQPQANEESANIVTLNDDQLLEPEENVNYDQLLEGSYSKLSEQFFNTVRAHCESENRNADELVGLLNAICNKELGKLVSIQQGTQTGNLHQDKLKTDIAKLDMLLRGRKGDILSSEPPNGFKEKLLDAFASFIGLFSASLSARLASDHKISEKVKEVIEKTSTEICDLYAEKIKTANILGCGI